MRDWSMQAFLSEDVSNAIAINHSFLGEGLPFSFTYGGVSSAELIPQWTRSSETRDFSDKSECKICWIDPKSGLQVTAVVTIFKNYPAVDWILYFENQGEADTPIIENIQAVDMKLNSDTGLGVLHYLNGDDSGIVGQDSFSPVDWPLYVPRTARLASDGGRSSSVGFPFFNYEYDGQGVVVAIGWTGQWVASLEHTPAGPTHLKAGMERTHLLLHSGEKIRSPRILLLSWSGDRVRAHNQFRRLMLDHYSPKPNGKCVTLPIALQTFDRYRKRPDWGTEAGQLKGVEAAHELGCDTYWLDATWYEGGFPNGAGNWFVDTKAFPNGLKPISDACHERGMKFVLWFDPERVASGTQIDREYPQWVLKIDQPNTWGLFDLGNPEARRWLTDLLSKRITEAGLDIYRHDFNVAPLKYWQAKDTPNRQGMSEIRHVEGLYEMWGELLAKHPGLVIDNCASGGRRIDIETCKLAVPLWRSDSGCWDSPEEWYQTQTAGLSWYVPLHTSGIQSPIPYTFRSAATGGAICGFPYLDTNFAKATAISSIEEVKQNQKYWYGDFYPLTSANVATDHLVACQFHRADLDEGIVLAFRRQNCSSRGVIVSLGGILSDRQYTLEFSDDSRKKMTKTISGEILLSEGLPITLDAKRSSLLIRYKGSVVAK